MLGKLFYLVKNVVFDNNMYAVSAKMIDFDVFIIVVRAVCL